MALEKVSSEQGVIDFPPAKSKKRVFPEPFRLEIAAGDRPTEGFVHNDVRPLDEIEIVCDCLDLPDVIETKATVIFANHILEHFSWRETEDVLKTWGSLLIPDEGMIHVEVPSLTGQAKALLSGELPDEEVVNLAYGDQNYNGNFHKTGFTKKTLVGSLWRVGFRSIAFQDVGMVLVVEAVWKPDAEPSDHIIYAS